MRIAPSALRFASVGVVATLIHVVVAVGLIEGKQLHPSIANGIAFIVANQFSYVANTHWAFVAKINIKSWYRFAAVSFISWMLTIAISWLVAEAGGSYKLGILIVVIFVPVFNYISHRDFTYR